MNKNQANMPMGALFRDTALQVVMQADASGIVDVRRWRDAGIGLVESLRQKLNEAGVEPETADEIIYAQCALLDESALRQAGLTHEEARHAWESEPLQVKYFDDYNAGEVVYQRIAALLRRPSPDPWLVDTYRAILGLGFLGRFVHVDDPERQETIRALDDIAPPHQAPALLVHGERMSWWRRWSGMGPFWWAAISIAFTIMLGLLLSRQLDMLVASIQNARG